MKKNENKKVKVICFYCSHNIFVNEETIECDICHSKNFLIEKHFAIEEVIAQEVFLRALMFSSSKIKLLLQ